MEPDQLLSCSTAPAAVPPPIPQSAPSPVYGGRCRGATEGGGRLRCAWGRPLHQLRWSPSPVNGRGRRLQSPQPARLSPQFPAKNPAASTPCNYLQARLSTPLETRVILFASRHHSEIMTSGWCREVGWCGSRSASVRHRRSPWTSNPGSGVRSVGMALPPCRNRSRDGQSFWPRQRAALVVKLTGHRGWRAQTPDRVGEALASLTHAGLPGSEDGASPRRFIAANVTTRITGRPGAFARPGPHTAVGRASPLGIDRPERKESTGWPSEPSTSGWPSEPSWDRLARAEEEIQSEKRTYALPAG